MQAVEASVAPLVQGPPLLRESAREAEVYPISSDDTSRAREVVDAEETDAVEQPAPLLDEGNSTLMRVRPEPRGWDHPLVLWRSRDDPEGEPLFTLEDVAEGGTGALSSNSANWRSGHCGQRCPLWPRTCPVSSRFVLSSLVPCCLSSEFSRST